MANLGKDNKLFVIIQTLHQGYSKSYCTKLFHLLNSSLHRPSQLPKRRYFRRYYRKYELHYRVKVQGRVILIVPDFEQAYVKKGLIFHFINCVVLLSRRRAIYSAARGTSKGIERSFPIVNPQKALILQVLKGKRQLFCSVLCVGRESSFYIRVVYAVVVG